MRQIHVMNDNKKNATVLLSGVKPPKPPRIGLHNKEISFRRFVAATEVGLHTALAKKFGEDYGQALIDDDPDVDMEQVGRFISSTDTVYLSSDGNILHVSPKVIEVLFGPDGTETERRQPTEVPANINDEYPVCWTGLKLPKAEAIRKFAFKRTIQLHHTNGLTYDFLFEMAKTLHEEGVVVMMGTGPNGKDPLMFQANGTPYRPFLEGRVYGERFQLLMHLSNLELKTPPVSKER
jgi:hypothetical protein